MDSLKKLNGIFPLFKPKNITSAACLDDLKRVLQKAILGKHVPQRKFAKICKVGHGGTLDPLATGVLIVGLNDGCKLLGKALSGRKVYRFKAKLGQHFDTYDCTGKLVEERTVPGTLDRRAIEQVCLQFIGPQVMQRPPPFSAVHVDGQRAYDLARRGTPVELPAKAVRIDRLTLVDYDADSLMLAMEMECGGGTYVRSLIVDLAAALGTCGHMVELERTFQEPFNVEQCLRLEDCSDLERIKGLLQAK
jgi:tRNA pseudouridine55 synthase